MLIRPIGSALRSIGRVLDGAGSALQGSEAFQEKRESTAKRAFVGSNNTRGHQLNQLFPPCWDVGAPTGQILLNGRSWALWVSSCR
jgi:hypothetical protein